MDITLVGRGVDITDRFRTYVTEKTDRVEKLAEKALALEIRVSRHKERNGNTGDDRVELTLIGPGPVVRAESGGPDKYAAFDVAIDKLIERVRRAKDRKKVHRGHGNRITSLREAATGAFAAVAVTPADGDAIRWAENGPSQAPVLPEDAEEVAEAEEAYTPMVIRQKRFTAPPMTVDDALYRMELVGHDFYLFIDRESLLPTVVYRRKGWDYGVLTLDTVAEGTLPARPDPAEALVAP